MKNLLLFALLINPLFIAAQQNLPVADAMVTPKIAETTLTVGGNDADVPGFNNRSIQYAIDAVARTGGTVKLNPGLYKIAAPVRMKSNVRLIGSGKQTILKRGKGFQTRFVVDADYGELKLTVENADGFEPGMKIQVSDKEQSSCWNVSTAWITDIRDNIIYIDNGLIRDYRADKEGMVSSSTSVIEAIGAENVTISDLTVDGNRAENFFADGCNCAGIMIFKSKKVIVDKVHVKDFNGEGISWQITENITIRNSEISGSGNTGLHPGTGSPFTIIENNDIHHNDRDGLFICWRVYQSQVVNNRIHHNGRFGICTGHKDTDVNFTGNHIYSNGNDGVNLRGEREANSPHRNTFTANIIEDNGQNGGGYGFSINSPSRDLILRNNIFRSSDLKKQKAAIYVYSNGSKPVLTGNRTEGNQPEIIYEKK
jgi:hypothetical protein